MQTIQIKQTVQAPCKKELLLQSLQTKHRLTHMTKFHKDIWSSFLHNNPDLFTHAAYDVRVGKGCTMDPTWPKYIKRMATKLTQKRIDVIALRNDRLWCIEIKQIPDISSPGQVVAYCQLLEEFYQTKHAPIAALLYQYHSWDLERVCFRLGVQMFRPNGIFRIAFDKQ